MKRPRTLRQGVTADRKRYDAARLEARPWRAWYGSKEWRAIRKRQLATQPLCQRHKAQGIVREATVVNHVDPHKGDWDKFISGPFESLCKPCHDSLAQRDERAAGRAAIERRGQ